MSNRESDNLKNIPGLGQSRNLGSQFFEGGLLNRSKLIDSDIDTIKRAPTKVSKSSQSVEVVLVKIAHQPFGLLMSQVYNIVRPPTGEFKVLTWPDATRNKLWSEIVYQEEPLRVLELARMLELPTVEPLERSRILLTGLLLSNGTIKQPFGLAVDDILAVQLINKDDIRLLPDWISRKRLGKLLWGAALLDRAILNQQSVAGELQAQDVLAPMQLADFMAEAFSAEAGANSDLTALQALLPPSQPMNITMGRAALITETNVGGMFKPPVETHRPVMLLDVSCLKPFAYNTMTTGNEN